MLGTLEVVHAVLRGALDVGHALGVLWEVVMRGTVLRGGMELGLRVHVLLNRVLRHALRGHHRLRP